MSDSIEARRRKFFILFIAGVGIVFYIAGLFWLFYS